MQKSKTPVLFEVVFQWCLKCSPQFGVQVFT